jgi:hypothetical protein
MICLQECVIVVGLAMTSAQMIDEPQSIRALSQHPQDVVPRHREAHTFRPATAGALVGMPWNLSPYGLTQHIHAFAPCRFTKPTVEHQPHDHFAGCPVRGPLQSCGELKHSV